MRKFTLLLTVLWLSLQTFQALSQTYDDPVKKIWSEIQFKESSNSMDSARFIFAWVTTNISYDTHRRFRLSTSRDTFLELAHRVAEERTAVCLGYAALFNELCDLSGIPCYVVKGRVYVPSEDAFENHAWVVFRSDQDWHLADPTWGSGYVAGHRFTYHQNWSFFDPEPKKFIATHYPFDPVFQLLKNPVNYKDFLRNGQIPEGNTDSFQYASILNNELAFDDPVKGLERSLQYKPEDPFLMHDLATYLQEEASSLVRDCISEFNNSGSIANESDCQENILLAEKRLLRAVNLFEELLKMDAPQKDTAWMNLASTKNNLKTIQILKQNTY